MGEAKIKENKLLFFVMFCGILLMVYALFLKETFLQVLAWFFGFMISFIGSLMLRETK